MKYILTTIILSFCFSIYVSAQETKIQKCKTNLKGGKYQLVSVDRTISGDKGLFMFIVVKSENINREYMIQLANRLNAEYCNENNLNVVIYDSKKLVTNGSFHYFMLSGGKDTPPMRGFYVLSRNAEIEGIEYSTKRGNPTNEVYIKLSEGKDQIDALPNQYNQ